MGMPLMDVPGSPTDKERLATLEANLRHEREINRHNCQALKDLRSEFEDFRRTHSTQMLQTGLRLPDGNGLMLAKVAGAVALVALAAVLQAAGHPDLAAKATALSRGIP